MNKTLLGILMVFVATVTLAVGAPVQANDSMMKEPTKGRGAAPMMMSHLELRNAMRMLWEEHIVYTRNFIISSLAGLEDAGPIAERLLRNQDDIAMFLGGANPNWPVQTLKDLLYKHLEYTTTEVVSRLKKDWAADIQAYDQGHAHMLMFADALTDGILKQFPKKFRK